MHARRHAMHSRPDAARRKTRRSKRARQQQEHADACGRREAGQSRGGRARHLGATEGDSDAGRPTRGRQPTAVTTTSGATAHARTQKTPAAAGNAPLLFLGDAERPAQACSAASNACAPGSRQLFGGDRGRERVRSCRHRPGKCRTGPGAAPISRRSEKTPPSPLPRPQCTRSQGRKRGGRPPTPSRSMVRHR